MNLVIVTIIFFQCSVFRDVLADKDKTKSIKNSFIQQNIRIEKLKSDLNQINMDRVRKQPNKNKLRKLMNIHDELLDLYSGKLKKKERNYKLLNKILVKAARKVENRLKKYSNGPYRWG